MGFPALPKGSVSSFKVKYLYDQSETSLYRDFGIGVATKESIESRFDQKWYLGDKGGLRLDGVFVKNYTRHWLKSGDIVEVIFD